MKSVNRIFARRLYKNFITNKAGISNAQQFNFSSKKNLSSEGEGNIKHGTTVLTIRRNNKVTMIADGLMTIGSIRFKTDTIKIRKLTDNIMCGFAGSVADCFSLMELLESEVEQYPKDLMRACVNLAKAWKTGKSYRRISASLVVSDGTIVLNVDGEGNVIEINDGIIGIGSGGLFAQCAAKAYIEAYKDNTTIDNKEIVKNSMNIATDLCIYSNKNYVIEELESKI